jgi:RNA polymerase sigma factor (sigma-70 family)
LTTPLSDQDLIAAANRDNAEAMTTRYHDWVYQVACRHCRDPVDAQDVIQEVFIYFFGKFPGFRLTSQFNTFLYPAIRNRSIDVLRKHDRMVTRTDPVTDDIPSTNKFQGNDITELVLILLNRK